LQKAMIKKEKIEQGVVNMLTVNMDPFAL